MSVHLHTHVCIPQYIHAYACAHANTDTHRKTQSENRKRYRNDANDIISTWRQNNISFTVDTLWPWRFDRLLWGCFLVISSASSFVCLVCLANNSFSKTFICVCVYMPVRAVPIGAEGGIRSLEPKLRCLWAAWYRSWELHLVRLLYFTRVLLTAQPCLRS